MFPGDLSVIYQWQVDVYIEPIYFGFGQLYP